MAIETEYRGYNLRYVENEDIWRCFDLDIEASKLSALKSKVAKIDNDARKAEATPVFVIQWGRVVGGVLLSWVDDGHVWVVCDKRRRKEKAADIVLDTPEVRAEINRAVTLEKQAQTLRAEASAIHAALPRISAVKDEADGR